MMEPNPNPNPSACPIGVSRPASVPSEPAIIVKQAARRPMTNPISAYTVAPILNADPGLIRFTIVISLPPHDFLTSVRACYQKRAAASSRRHRSGGVTAAFAPCPTPINPINEPHGPLPL